jgi:hypothetical protein
MLKSILIVALVCYGGLLSLLYLTQRAMQYFPSGLRTAPAEAGLPEAQEIELETPDGERVIAWHLPPRGDKPVISISTAMAARCADAPTASRAHRRRHRARCAELPRLRRLQRPADGSGPHQGCHAGATPSRARATRPSASCSGASRWAPGCGRARCGKAGRARHPRISL